jgi:hypothetical protein
MQRVVLAGLLISALGFSTVSTIAQESSNTAVLGSVTLTRKVLADGQPLAPGTYQVRLSAEQVKPVVGESPDSERYVEFVRAGKVIGREAEMVGKRVRPDVEAHLLKLRKKALGVADPSDRMQGPIAPVGRRCAQRWIEQVPESLACEPHSILRGAHPGQYTVAVDHYRVDQSQTSYRLAQRPARDSGCLVAHGTLGRGNGDRRPRHRRAHAAGLFDRRAAD